MWSLVASPRDLHNLSALGASESTKLNGLRPADMRPKDPIESGRAIVTAARLDLARIAAALANLDREREEHGSANLGPLLVEGEPSISQ
jgi:hypothetical protein